MTSNSGTETPYSSIGGNHLFLSLNGASDGEIEFNSGLRWSDAIKNIMFDTPIVSGCADKVAAKIDYSNGLGVASTIYDLLKHNPRLTKVTKMVERVGYARLIDLSRPITFFAPLDDEFESYLTYPLFSSLDKQQSQLQVLQYHTLPFQIDMWQLINRRLRLNTFLSPQTIETDFTSGKSLVINPLEYGVSTVPWFPQTCWDVHILDRVSCDGGVLYIISRPLVPVYM